MSRELDTGQINPTVQETSEKGIANGYAALDASAEVPSLQFPTNIAGTKNFDNTVTITTSNDSLLITPTWDVNEGFEFNTTDSDGNTGGYIFIKEKHDELYGFIFGYEGTNNRFTIQSRNNSGTSRYRLIINRGDDEIKWLQTNNTSEMIKFNTDGGSPYIRINDNSGTEVTRIVNPTGNYGSFQIDGNARTGYEGYSIGGRVVFMHNNSTVSGIYDDVNNHWMLRTDHNSYSYLYYDGNTKLNTISTGIDVTGNVEGINHNGTLQMWTQGGYGSGTSNLYYKVGQWTLGSQYLYGIVKLLITSRYGDAETVNATCERGASVINVRMSLQKRGLNAYLTFYMLRTSANVCELWCRNGAAWSRPDITVINSREFSFEWLNSTGQASLPTYDELWNEDGYIDISNSGALASSSTISATSFTEGGTGLSSKYLGISAKAADTNLLDGYNSDTGWTANTVPLRESSGDITARLFRSNYQNQTTISGGMAHRVNNSSDPYIRFCSSASAIRTWASIAASSHTHSNYLASNADDDYTGGTRIKFNDGKRIDFGSSNDMRWFHSTHNYIDVYNGDLYIRDDTTTRYTFDVSAGYCTAYNWYATSDIRLKENIKKLEKSLDKVTKIGQQAVRYTRKDIKDKTERIGFIAQEIEKIYPEFVDEDESANKIKSINYSKMVVPLYKGVSEMKTILENRTIRINKIRKKLKQLQND